eukprot:1718126-Lingulodinium_polyedra.AAC.1
MGASISRPPMRRCIAAMRSAAEGCAQSGGAPVRAACVWQRLHTKRRHSPHCHAVRRRRMAAPQQRHSV